MAPLNFLRGPLKAPDFQIVIVMAPPIQDVSNLFKNKHVCNSLQLWHYEK